MLVVLSFVVLSTIFVGCGIRMSRVLDVDSGPRGERWALAFVLSTGLVTLVGFLLAAARVFTPGTCAAVAVGMGAAALGPLWAGIRALARPAWREGLWPSGGLDRCMTGLAAAFLGLGLVMALAPPTGMDTGVYHFTIPKLIVQNHGLVSRDDVWVHKSGGFYVVYAFGMALGGEILAKLLAFAMAVAGVGLCAAVAERLRGGTGRTAAYLLLSTPVSAGYLGYEYLELPVLTYVLAATLSVVRGAESRSWIVLGCVFAGLAISAKTTAFAGIVLVPAALAALREREGAKGAWTAVLSLGAFGVAAGFWYAWNRVTTGSFVSPYSGVGPDSPASAEGASRWSGLAPFLGSLATTGRYWTDSAGPFIFAGLAGFAFYLWNSERRTAVVLLLASLGVYVGVVALLSPTYLSSPFGPRYYAPYLIGFGAPAAAQFAGWVRGRPGLLRGAVLAALLVPSLPLVVLKAGKAAVAAPVALGLESRSAYLTKKIETYAACDLLNRLPSPRVKVLFVGVRPYYLDRPFVWIPYTGAVPFLRGIATREEFLSRLREEGITHVIYEPSSSRDAWFSDPDRLFTSPFREIERWPWKGSDWVRLYALEAP